MAFQSSLTRFAASCLALLACMPAPAATTAELLRLTDQLDQMDQMDFDQAIDKANKCIQARDFSCSEAQLKAARKRATTSAAKDHLRRTETLQRAEKEAVEVERQALARRQRELEEEERRLQAAEERAARQAARAAEEDSGMSTAQGAALFGSLLSQAYKSQAAARVAEATQGRRIQQQLEASRADVARNQQRFAEERARIEAQRVRLQRQQQEPTKEERRPSQQIAQQREESATRESAAASKPQGQSIAANDVQSSVGSGSTSRRTGASSTERQTESSPKDGDIRETNPYLGGYGSRLWLGPWYNRQATSSRLEACQISERLREEQITLDGQGAWPRRVEQRSECVCSYRAFTKAWSCATWYLPVGSPVDSPGLR